MCTPMMGAVVGAVGSLYSGYSQMQMANYNAKVAKINAEAAVLEGNYRGGITRRNYDEQAGAQQAALAKSGVILDTGTAQVLSIEQGFRTEQAAGIDIWQGQTEATKYRNEAKAYKAQGKAAMVGGVINAASSLIGGMSGQGSPTSSSGGPSTGPVALGTSQPSVPSLRPQPLFYNTPLYGYSGFGGMR